MDQEMKKFRSLIGNLTTQLETLKGAVKPATRVTWAQGMEAAEGTKKIFWSF